MRPKPYALFSILVAVAAMTSFHITGATAKADHTYSESFVVDVSVDHETFAIVPSTGLVLHPEPLGPNRGTPFVVDGTIFPGHTLPAGSGVGDPNMPGRIGLWICKGIFTSEIGSADIGFDTTQMFEFDGDADAIWTEGLEAGLGKAGVITHRTILGGTGRFQGAEGEVVQEALGTNVEGTPNIRLTFKILKKS